MSPATSLEAVELIVDPVSALVVEAEAGVRPEEMHAGIGAAFDALMHGLRSCSARPSAPPRVIYHAYDAQRTRFSVAYPVASPPSCPPDGGVLVRELPGGRFMRFTHHGPYARLMESYEGIMAWLKERDMPADEAAWDCYMPMWEEYLNDPETTPAEELVTHIYLPLP